MAASKNDKNSYALLSEYVGLYRNKYGQNPIINKYKEKWAMQSLIDDFGVEDVGLTLEYYFKVTKEGHPLSWFFNNFSTLYSSKKNAEKDEDVRMAARQRTSELRAEYLNGLS